MEKFYITTAIAYTSRKPHIGNTYEIVLTDAIARFKRMMGYDVFFLTGTDEHGQKIEECAVQSGMTCKEYVDCIAGEVKSIWDLMGASYDKFIRTTDDYHVKQVQKIFKKLYEKGDIYKSEYEGMYCVPCETFFTQTQLADGKCPECGREVTAAKEEAYFFKMAKYADKLMAHIDENPDFIVPEARKKEMVNNFIKPGLQDLCVSRSTFKWGVPVSFDDGHVIYVWIDALSNYITALGFDVENASDLYKKNWPADLHVIGKDILRFHTIYWPIILMALGEPLPKQIFGHPWLLNDENKMSKSVGNVIYADDLVRVFGTDAVRYYLLREMPYAQDGSITYENIIARFNADLANTLGNLVNRTVSMCKKYFDGVVENSGVAGEFDDSLRELCLKTREIVTEKMNEYRTADALEAIISQARRCNKYIDETMPWVLAKDEASRPRLKTVLYNLIEGIRFTAVLLAPFMPAASDEILRQINADCKDFASLEMFGKTVSGVHVNDAVPLFVRVDEQEKLKELRGENVEIITGKPEISIDDFAKLELKVGEVIVCNHVEGADKLLVSKIKIGGEVRQIVSGIAKFYPPEKMVGKKVVVVTNLKPVKLRGVLSQGMILAASDEKTLSIVSPDKDIASGAEVR